MKAFLKHDGKTNNTLRKAVIENLGDIETLSDVARHGAQACYGNFCYYVDTTAFFDKHKRDILLLAQSDAQDFGVTMIDMIASFNCLKDVVSKEDVESFLIGLNDSEYDFNNIHIKNALTWYTLESVAYDYQTFKGE